MTMNRIRALLAALERSAVRPSQRAADIEARALQDLCCPLPDGTTDAEVERALELLTAAQAAIQRDATDLRALDCFRDYSVQLHRRHGGEYAGEELSDGT